MANSNIGRVKCPFCQEIAAVRQYAKGSRALYFYCANDGLIRPALAHGQAWMKANAEFYEGHKPASEPEPEPNVTEEKDAEPKRKGRGLLGGIPL